MVGHNWLCIAVFFLATGEVFAAKLVETHQHVIDVVITLKTDVLYVRQVVNSLLKHKPNRAILEQRVIFVDDGSPIETR